MESGSFDEIFGGGDIKFVLQVVVAGIYQMDRVTLGRPFKMQNNIAGVIAPAYGRGEIRNA